MTLALPASLLERLRTRRVVLVAGLGASGLAGGQGWMDVAGALGQALADENDRTVVQGLVASGRLKAALAHARDRLGTERVAAALASLPGSAASLPAGVAALAKAPWRGIVTTSSWDLWARALAAAGAAPTILDAGAFDGSPLGPDPFLVHLFGRLDDPRSVCLVPADVRHKAGGPALVSATAALARKWSFVFAGFSPTDPDLAWIVERLTSDAPPDVEHYLVAPGPAAEAAVLGAELGLVPVVVPGDGEQALEALAQAVVAAGAAPAPPVEDLEAWFAAWTRDPADPEPREALAAAERRLRARKDWSRVVELLVGRMEHLPDPAEQARTLHEVARLLEAELGAPDRAYTTLQTAIGIAPPEPALVDDMARLARGAGTWVDFLRDYAAAIEALDDGPRKAAHLRTLARHHREGTPADDAAAIDALERARAMDPRSAEGLPELAALLARRGRAAAAGDLLDDLAGQRAAAGDAAGAVALLLEAAANAEQAPARVRRLTRAARLLETGGDSERAVDLWEQVFAVDSTSREAAAQVAGRFERGGRWAELDAALATLAGPGESTDAGLLRRRAACARSLGRLPAARAHLAAALRLRPSDRAIVEEALALEDPGSDAAIALRRQLTPLLERHAQAPAWEALGDDLAARGDAAGALTAYGAALASEPGRRSVLFKRLELETAAKAWREAIEDLVLLAEGEPEPSARGRTFYAAAVIARDELGDAARAVELLERTVDAAPTTRKALDAVERLLRASGDTTRLAAICTNALGRLPADADVELRARLWQMAGEIALEKFKDSATAAVALDVAGRLRPGEAGHQDRLAALYLDAGDDVMDKGVAAQRALVCRSPDRPAPYEALARLWGRIGARDRQWWAAAALVHLGLASGELRQLHAEHRPPLPQARRPFTEDLWALIGHPDADGHLEALFRVLGPSLALCTARPHALAGLDRSAKVSLPKAAGRPQRAGGADGPWFPAAALRFVADALGVAAPEIYLSDEDSALAVRNVSDGSSLVPAFVVGGAMAGWTREEEITFVLARAAALLRPEWSLRFALPGQALLELAVRIGLALAGAERPADAAEPEVVRVLPSVRTLLAPDALGQLSGAAQALVGARKDPTDVRRWVAGGELTAARAALVVTGDLQGALSALSRDGGTDAGLPLEERIKDLLAFAVSEEHFLARAALGDGGGRSPTTKGARDGAPGSVSDVVSS